MNFIQNNFCLYLIHLGYEQSLHSKSLGFERQKLTFRNSKPNLLRCKSYPFAFINLSFTIANTILYEP